MAVPKRKTSKSRKNLRRSHDRLAEPARAKCQQCGAVKPPHRICTECGVYRGSTRIEIADEE